MQKGLLFYWPEMTITMTAETELTQLVEGLLPGPEYYVVALEIKGREGGIQKVQVLLDGDEGIGIDECSKVTRGLNAHLDEHPDLIPGKFILEVSSPGVDFPLVGERRFRRNLGRSLKVLTTDGHELNGTLLEATADGISLKLDPVKTNKAAREAAEAAEPKQLSYQEIKTAIVQIKF